MQHSVQLLSSLLPSSYQDFIERISFKWESTSFITIRKMEISSLSSSITSFHSLVTFLLLDPFLASFTFVYIENSMPSFILFILDSMYISSPSPNKVSKIKGHSGTMQRYSNSIGLAVQLSMDFQVAILGFRF